MIVLQNMYIEKWNSSIYLKSDCLINGELQTLWYATAMENEEYISTTNADSFLLVLFVYSIFNDEKLKSKVPISSELQYGLLEVLLPSFQKMGFHAVKSDFEFTKIDRAVSPNAKAIGTAMSFGVDSFYTFLDGQNKNKTINTITLFNAGAFGEYGGEKARSLFEIMKQKVAAFSEKTNKAFVWVDTNTSEILRMHYPYSSTFRNFACVFVLQKLFKEYFYASTLTLSNFQLTSVDTSYYDLLISKAVKGNSLEFHISGLNKNRLDKTNYISDEDIIQKHLNVCLLTADNKELKEGENCSKCFKCVQTMLTLDTLGKLEEFHNVFSLETFNAYKPKYIGELMYRVWRMKDVDSKDILDEIKTKDYAIPPKSYWYLLLRAMEPISKRLFNNA